MKDCSQLIYTTNRRKRGIAAAAVAATRWLGKSCCMRAILILLSLLLPLRQAPAQAQAQEAVHGGPVRALAVAADGALASAGFDQSMILWDAPGRGRWCGGMRGR